MLQITVRRKQQFTGHRGAVFALENGQSPDQFRSAAGDGMVAGWDLTQPESGKVIAQVEGNLFSMANLADGNRLVLGNMYGGLHWVDLPSRTNLANVLHHAKGVFDLKIVGGQLWSAGADGQLTRWDADQFRPLESLHLCSQSLRTVAVAPSQAALAVGASNHAFYIVEPTTARLLAVVQAAHASSVFAAAYSPYSPHLLTGGRDAQLKVWSSETYELVRHIPAHLYTINHLVFHPKQPIFATASRDRTIKIWDALTFELVKVIDNAKFGGHIASVNRLLWLENQTNDLVSASDDRTVLVWEIQLSIV